MLQDSPCWGQMGENYFFDSQSQANLEPTNIKYRIDNAFHMLRHFEGMDEQLQANLLRAGHVEKNIQAELTLPGSRFFANFASDIPGLLNRICLYPFVILETGDRNIQLNGQVSSADFPKGIGTKAVLHVDELSASQRAAIFLRKNRGLDLLHLRWTRFRPPGSSPWCSGLPSRAMFSSLHFLALRPYRFPSTGWAEKGKRNARLFGISMFSWLRRVEKAVYHLNNALAQVNPLPNAARQTVSPSLIRPFSQASQRAMGTDAAVVLP